MPKYGMEDEKKKLIMGLIVQSLRESLRMSRYALARDAEVDNSWLRRFETGKSGIRVETLIALARGMKVPSATIITAMEKGLANPDKWLEAYANSRQGK
jgi:transcriptional regulator with XRE-family HTH domain